MLLYSDDLSFNVTFAGEGQKSFLLYVFSAWRCVTNAGVTHFIGMLTYVTVFRGRDDLRGPSVILLDVSPNSSICVTSLNEFKAISKSNGLKSLKISV